MWIDEEVLKTDERAISGGVVVGAVGFWLYLAYQFNVGQPHFVMPPWMYSYAAALLLLMQAGTKQTNG